MNPTSDRTRREFLRTTGAAGLAATLGLASEKTPAVLQIPGGYAHGTMSLTEDVRAVFFSTASLAESLQDDIRFDARTWDPWSVKER